MNSSLSFLLLGRRIKIFTLEQIVYNFQNGRRERQVEKIKEGKKREERKLRIGRIKSTKFPVKNKSNLSIQ